MQCRVRVPTGAAERPDSFCTERWVRWNSSTHLISQAHGHEEADQSAATANYSLRPWLAVSVHWNAGVSCLFRAIFPCRPRSEPLSKCRPWVAQNPNPTRTQPVQGSPTLLQREETSYPHSGGLHHPQNLSQSQNPPCCTDQKHFSPACSEGWLSSCSLTLKVTKCWRNPRAKNSEACCHNF